MGRITETIQVPQSKLNFFYNFNQIISHALKNHSLILLLKVIFIHSSDTDGRALVGRFQSTSQNQQDDVEIKIQVLCFSITMRVKNAIFAEN